MDRKKELVLEDRQKEGLIAELPPLTRRFLRELAQRGTWTSGQARIALGIKGKSDGHFFGGVLGPIGQLKVKLCEVTDCGTKKTSAGGRRRRLRFNWIAGPVDWDRVERLARPTARVLSKPSGPTLDRAVIISRPPRERWAVDDHRCREEFEPDESRGLGHGIPPVHEPGWASSGGRLKASRRPVAANPIVEIKGKVGTPRRLT